MSDRVKQETTISDRVGVNVLKKFTFSSTSKRAVH